MPGLPVLLYDIGRYASAGADLNPMCFSPLPDGLGIRVTGCRRLAYPPATYLATTGNELAEAVAEPVGVAI